MPDSKPQKQVSKKPSGKALWDVKTQGVMLAHTYKDPKSGKVKTPPKDFHKHQ